MIGIQELFILFQGMILTTIPDVMVGNFLAPMGKMLWLLFVSRGF